MRVKQSDFLEALDGKLYNITAMAESFRGQLEENWLKKENPVKWNASECIAHLILSNEFYLEQIIAEVQKAIQKGDPPSLYYKRGWLGKYLSKNILPKEDGKKSTMKTFKWMEPKLRNNANESMEILDHYLQQLAILKEQIQQCKRTNIKKVRIKTAVGALLKLDLGNAIDFTLGHNIRHLLQAQRAFQF